MVPLQKPSICCAPRSRSASLLLHPGTRVQQRSYLDPSSSRSVHAEQNGHITCKRDIGAALGENLACPPGRVLDRSVATIPVRNEQELTRCKAA
jgi:hypothetical protein